MNPQRTQFWLEMCYAILQQRPFCRINPATPVTRRPATPATYKTQQIPLI